MQIIKTNFGRVLLIRENKKVSIYERTNKGENKSARKNSPLFTSNNCGSIPENKINSSI